MSENEPRSERRLTPSISPEQVRLFTSSMREKIVSPPGRVPHWGIPGHTMLRSEDSYQVTPTVKATCRCTLRTEFELEVETRLTPEPEGESETPRVRTYGAGSFGTYFSAGIRVSDDIVVTELEDLGSDEGRFTERRFNDAMSILEQCTPDNRLP